MHRYLTYQMLLCVLLSVAASAQDSADVSSVFRLERTIPGTYVHFTVDALDQVYGITPSGQLKKTSPQGDSIGVYNNVKKFGVPAVTDASNPLKTLLFYPPYATLVILDRLLTFRYSINLRNQQLFRVNVAALSYDSQVWIYDEQDCRIRKLDEEGRIISETPDLRQLLTSAPTATALIDHNFQLYLYDPENGFYIFDYYGALKNTLPLTGWKQVCVRNGVLFGFREGQLQVYDPRKPVPLSYRLPAGITDNTVLQIMNQKLFVLQSRGIDVYAIAP